MSIIDMSLTPNEFLLARINALYGSKFTLQNVYIGSEGVQATTQYGCDSKVRLIAIAGKGYSGVTTVYFSKVNFDDFLAGQFLEVEQDQYFDTDDMLLDVLVKLGINLRRMDIISDIIPIGATTANIRISNICPCYRGTIKVKLSPSILLLSTRLPKVILDGFNINNEVE